jgi:hypothetical protein
MRRDVVAHGEQDDGRNAGNDDADDDGGRAFHMGFLGPVQDGPDSFYTSVRNFFPSAGKRAGARPAPATAPHA